MRVDRHIIILATAALLVCIAGCGDDDSEALPDASTDTDTDSDGDTDTLPDETYWGTVCCDGVPVTCADIGETEPDQQAGCCGDDLVYRCVDGEVEVESCSGHCAYDVDAEQMACLDIPYPPPCRLRGINSFWDTEHWEFPEGTICCDDAPTSCADIAATPAEQFVGCCGADSVHWCVGGELVSEDCWEDGLCGWVDNSTMWCLGPSAPDIPSPCPDLGSDTDIDSDTDTDSDTDSDACEPHMVDGACVTEDIECKCIESPWWCENNTHDSKLAEIETWSGWGGACMFWCADGHSYYHSYGADESMDYHFDGETGDIIGYLYTTDSAAFYCDGEDAMTEIFGFTDCTLDCLIAATEAANCAEDAPACELDGGVDGGK